ncbi:MAG: GTP 3',8-cyclase MoaA [Chloroflexi bacterium]|nr:GTP 3',8-cyclase MoaA [Chloroflexota bacterium]
MLTDHFGRPMRDLRISVTDRCNFRCPYCMPAEIYGEAYEFLPRADILTFEELTRLVSLFAEQGISKLRITGGEPLLRNDLSQLLGMLTNIEGINDLTLTTNGYLLGQFAQDLKNAGLARITISLDSLDDDVFKAMNGRGFTPDRVLDAIQTASDVGLSPIKINCVVQKGVNDHTIVDLARHFKGTGHIVRYIEYMDVGNRNGWRSEHVVPAEEIIAKIDAEMPLEPVESNYQGEVATRYRYKDGSGEIGVIASVTKPFCGDCTRVRLSTDGQIFTCLFASEGVSLMTPLRDGASDDELRKILVDTWTARTDRYSEERAAAPNAPGSPRKIEMFQIGG